MIPILFAPNATTFTTNGITTNGIGRLRDAISCVVREERNGAFELEMVYPVTGAYFGDIVHSAIIVAKPSARRGLQAFRICTITRPLNGKVKILAQHISYQLSFIPVSPFSAASLANALTGFKTNAAESCPFTLSADFTKNSSFAIADPVSIRSYLGGVEGSILDIYGGEWEWNNYSCILHQSRGQDNGYVISYGKNLTDLNQEQNIQNTYTGLYPFWKSESVTVTLTEKVVHAATAANYPFQRTIIKDFSDKFDNAPTETQLRNYANAYMTANNIGIPAVSLSLSFVHLADYANIDLCDPVTVRFTKLGVDVKSKVVYVEWDVLKDRYSRVDVGDARGSLSSTIEEQIGSLARMATSDSVARSIDRATGVLNAGRRGHVIINRNSEGFANEILFMDSENLAEAVHVLRINMNGIGFSGNGYNGDYFQSWTLDGHLSLGGVNNSYGDLMILDENARPTVQVDKDGLKLWKVDAVGYYANGVFYADKAQTSVITPTQGNIYYDLSEGKMYVYSGTAYTAVSGKQGLLAAMTRDGLSVYAGTIDFDWGADTGFHADEDGVQIGDFICNSESGRSIFQSDEGLGRTTGMSAETDNPSQLYLWAGYDSANDYYFVVNGAGAYTMYNGVAYNIGQALSELNSAVAAYVQAHSSDDGDEPDPDASTPAPEEAYLEDGQITDDASQPSDPIGFDGPT